MSRAEELAWRFAGPLDRALALANRLPIGTWPIRVDGDRLYVDSIDRAVAVFGWKLGLLEAAERRLIARTVRPGAVVVDVGANVGLHTLGLARAVGPHGRVHALEPEPRNRRLLRRAVAGLQHVRVHPVAAADRDADVTLWVSAANRGDHRLHRSREARTAVPVHATTLDALLADEAAIDFVKIDVQGAELDVVRGATRLLASPNVAVLCELTPDLLARAGTRAADLVAWFVAAGLYPHRLNVDGSVSPLADAVGEAARAGYLNVLFRRD